MSPDRINDQTTKFLGKLRELLLEQHKLLLDRERGEYEKVNGPLGGPGQLLALVMGDAHFAWLKEISSLVVGIDEALSPRSKAGQQTGDALVTQAREIMRPRENGTEFQKLYYRAAQDSPDIVILQCRIEQLLAAAQPQ